MPIFMNSKKIIIIIVIASVFFIFVFYKLLAGNINKNSVSESKKDEAMQTGVVVTGTNPDPLENIIITENQIIKISFSDPLENIGEIKYKIDPKVELKVELSADRKTATLTPVKKFDLGNTYTLFITPDSKFDGGKRLSSDKVYHFRTVAFRGF